MLAQVFLARAAAATAAPCVLASCADVLAFSGSRSFSSLGAGGRSTRQLYEQVKDAIAAPLRSAQAAKESVSRAPEALYDSLPPNLQHFLSLMRRPTALQRTLTINCQATWQNHSEKIALGGGLLLTLSLWYGLCIPVRAALTRSAHSLPSFPAGEASMPHPNITPPSPPTSRHGTWQNPSTPPS
jgi:hypothetical protein